VREGAGSGSTPEHVVATLGGEVLDQLPAMSSFVAVLPADGVVTLAATPGVESVTPDGQVTLLSGSRDDRWIEDRGQPGSLSAVTSGLSLLQRFVSGKGVGVALIDSGIAPVEGLNSPDQVVNGVDLSFESQAPGLLHLDTFGHGTHMAGIINGRNPEIATNAAGETGMFTGVAPGSTVVNVKVAGADGAVDVSQVIAAIDWVVEHKNDNGMNVRVLNLSFGTQSTQSYLIDPLAHAAEVAWRNGIVVVVAAGNEGNETSMLNDPATDPYVLAVGASDQGNVLDPRDDKVAPFSSRGSLTRMPDILAPGKGIVSLRVPGSLLDQSYPSARMHDVTGDERFFRGSGTSQSAAVVSGVVALLLQYRPNLTPDQVKCLLTQTADRLPGVDPRLQGAGSLNVARAFLAGTPKNCVQTHPTSTGTGSLELARGGSHVADPDTGEELVGEIDIFGTPWDGRSWSAASMAGVSWSGGNFLGVSWSGVSWSGVSWSGRSWSGVSWSGRSWSGVSWSGRSWSGVSWSGVSWSGVSWSGRSWSGVSWSGRSWSGRSWR
jgi:serine protease AprX